MTFRVLDLFSGIGGASLGLHRAGAFKTVAFCDNNVDRRADLTRLFPGVKVYDDVSTLSASGLAADGIFPNLICGGFPCQDISVAGTGVGLVGSRSGLWYQYARIIEEASPEWIIIENSPRLRHLGLETILGFLDASGYDAFWDGISASSVGANHERDRLFIIANRDGNDGRQRRARGFNAGVEGQRKSIGTLHTPDIDGARLAFWQGFRGYLGEELATVKRDNLRNGSNGASKSGMVGTFYDVPATLDRPERQTRDAGLVWKSRVHGLGNSLIPCILTCIGRAIVRSTS